VSGDSAATGPKVVAKFPNAITSASTLS